MENPRPRLQRSISAREGGLQRSSSSRLWLLGHVPWASNNDDYYSSGGEDEPFTPLAPATSQEDAKRARKQKLQRLFKQGVSRVVKKRAEEMDQMAKMGSLYVRDAFAGRLQHGLAVMSTKPWYVFLAFRLQISSHWMWTIIVCSVAHSLLVFIEPRPGAPPDDGLLGPRALLALEVAFIAVYAADVALKVSYMGLKSYLKKPWQKLMIGIVVLLGLDATGVVGVRFARCLRPAILSLRTRSIRRFYAVVSQMLPGFLRVCLPVVFFLLLSASYAALSFGRAKSDFEDPGAAGYAIWILMACADNYESLVNDRPMHPAYLPFIVMVIVVGSIFLLDLLLGVTYDVFIEHTTEQVKQERMKELKGLNAAFATMDPEGTGKLSMVVWERFLLHLKPRTTRQERALYFEIASSFSDTLDVLGFMDLRQVLSYSFVNVNTEERQGKRKKWEKMPPRVARLLEAMEAMLATRVWRYTVATVVLLDCLMLPNSIPHQGPGLLVTRLTAGCGAVLLVDQAFQLAERMHQGSGPGPLRLPVPARNMHTKVAGVGVILHTAVVAILHCPPLLSFACSCLSFAMESFSGSSSSTPDFSAELSPEFPGGPELSAEGSGLGKGGGDDGWAIEVCEADEASVRGRGSEPLGVYGGGGGREEMCMEVDWCTDSLLMLAYTLRLVRCWRLVTLSDTLHDHVNTFFSVIPVFAQTLSFALIIAFFFAMVGMQAFADKAAAFSDAGVSFRTTLQLFVGVDFAAVVEDTVAEVGARALVFFVAYHVVGVLIVFNLLTAIMIQLYGEALNEKSRQGIEEQRMADQELQEVLYDHNQKRRVLRQWGKTVTQNAASLNITRETRVSSGRDARRMLGAGGGKSNVLTAEELQQCQKYAKVDLLRALRERDRAEINLRAFERSFYKKIKNSTSPETFNFEEFADGETIYHRGDQHPTCFFVHQGMVRLEYADGTAETKEKGEMFGEEALVSNLATAATAIAEGPVSCVGMDRDTFTEEHGTLENLGMVFLRLQRSGSFPAPDAPPSDCGREGSRRSHFGALSSRSSRLISGPSIRAPSQLDLFNSADLKLPERWRNRGSRNSGTGGGDSGGVSGTGSERAASMRGSLTKASTGLSSRSDVAGGSSRVLWREGKPSPESAIVASGRARSVSSSAPALLSARPKPTAVHQFPGGGDGGGGEPDEPATKSLLATAANRAGEDVRPPASSLVATRTGSEGSSFGSGGRAALLQNGRGIIGGFDAGNADADGGGCGARGGVGGTGEGEEGDSWGGSSVEGGSGRVDGIEGIEVTKVPSSSSPFSLGTRGGGGIAPRAETSADNPRESSEKTRGAGAAIGGKSGLRRAGGEGSQNPARAADSGMALDSVPDKGIRELGTNDRSLPGGISLDSSTGSSNWVAAGVVAGPPCATADAGAAGTGSAACVAAAAAAPAAAPAPAAGVSAGLTPVISPSEAPRSRKQHMLKARSSNADGGNNANASAGGSSTWSTSSPSPVVTAQKNA